jgi:DNA-binding FadR family transcriptional regulator
MSGTLAQHIVAQVRAALFAGRIKPGDFLGSEAGLAEQFKVSRMASRDALRTLEAMGIVDIRKGIKGGAFIARENPERFADALAIQLRLIGLDADEVFDAQLAIETHAAELAAARATPDQLAALRQALADCEAAARDLPGFTAMSIRFHEQVVQASCNRVLLAQFRALRFVLQPLLEPNTTGEVAKRVIRSHSTLLRAIEAGDAAEASAVMRQRITEVRARVSGQGRAAAARRPQAPAR